VVDIALATQEQAVGVQQVNVAINEMDRVTQQNAALVEESTAAGMALAEEAEVLAGLIRKFRVDDAAAPVARAMRSAA
jgi:methyl-accepting chemotaxis protein